jgi:glycosyltransferase involved in cell wall biosynthesis
MQQAPFVSVVIPAHNESGGLRRTHDTIAAAVAGCTDHYELIFVDDGSTDDTYSVIEELTARNGHVRGLRLSRNFGKEAALFAGLESARGDAVITMDADLQHPPAVIPRLIESWQQGYRIVNAIKEERPGDNLAVRLRARLFNGLLSSLGGIDVERSSDYKLLDRTVVDILIKHMPERLRFYRGLSHWLGFEQASVPFTVPDRAEGQSKWSLLALVELALTAIVSFTSAPLRLVSLLGVMTLVLGFVIGSDALWSWFHGRAVSGFTTTITTVLILASFIMISLGIIGEYIAKIYDEIKQRPVYLVASACGPGHGDRMQQPADMRSSSRVIPPSMSERPEKVADEVPGQNQ